MVVKIYFVILKINLCIKMKTDIITKISENVLKKKTTQIAALLKSFCL